jgi:hypothetical protein
LASGEVRDKHACAAISMPKYSCTRRFRIAITLAHGIAGCATRNAWLIERAASPMI